MAFEPWASSPTLVRRAGGSGRCADDACSIDQRAAADRTGGVPPPPSPLGKLINASPGRTTGLDGLHPIGRRQCPLVLEPPSSSAAFRVVVAIPGAGLGQVSEQFG